MSGTDIATVLQQIEEQEDTFFEDWDSEDFPEELNPVLQKAGQGGKLK